MKIINSKNIILLLLFVVFAVSACHKEEQEAVPVVVPEADEVNKFIHTGLRDYYLWNRMVPALYNAKYENKDTLNALLNKYNDPQKLFTSLLYDYGKVDKWSFLVDDSKEIDDWISGISKTMGYDFMLGRVGPDNDVYGFVRYVYTGSPAEKAGLKRGDVFLTINDQQLTIANYQKLLFQTETYKMGFALITPDGIMPILRNVTMTAIEMQENPINKDTTFIFENRKIGYLVYNGFNADFDIELNNVFKKFKDENIDQLVVDLRYNGGGSVMSSIYLASMIYGTDNTKVFSRSMYNEGLEYYFKSEGGDKALDDYFTKAIEVTEKSPATPINTLNMKKVYFIVSDNSASASELLINGLRPYMNVVVVGINTYGKYTGSFTIRDWDENGNVNPNHKYAMQPIVVKYANANGYTDYVNGLVPTIRAEEDIANLLPFGDPNETLLKVVLDDIKGNPVTGMVKKSAKIGLRKVADSHDYKPFAHEMYINPKLKFKQ